MAPEEKERKVRGFSEWIAKRRWQWARPAARPTWNLGPNVRRPSGGGTVPQKILAQIEKERIQKHTICYTTIVVSQFECDSGYARQVCLWKPGSHLRGTAWRQFFNCPPRLWQPWRSTSLSPMSPWLPIVFFSFLLLFFFVVAMALHYSHNRQWKAPQHCRLHIKICFRLQLVNCTKPRQGAFNCCCCYCFSALNLAGSDLGSGFWAFILDPGHGLGPEPNNGPCAWAAPITRSYKIPEEYEKNKKQPLDASRCELMVQLASAYKSEEARAKPRQTKTKLINKLIMPLQ